MSNINRAADVAVGAGLWFSFKYIFRIACLFGPLWLIMVVYPDATVYVFWWTLILVHISLWILLACDVFRDYTLNVLGMICPTLNRDRGEAILEKIHHTIGWISIIYASISVICFIIGMYLLYKSEGFF